MKEQNQNDVARFMLMLAAIASAVLLLTGCEKEPTECTQCREEWTKNNHTNIRVYNVTDCSDDGARYTQLTSEGFVNVKVTCN